MADSGRVASLETKLSTAGHNAYALNAGRQLNVFGMAVRSVTASETLCATDMFVDVDATAGAVTVTLPPASSSFNQLFVIKKTDATASVVTVDGDGSETIDGVTTAKLERQYDWIMVVSDGTEWFVVGGCVFYAGSLTSDTATDGHVLTADGAGGTAFEALGDAANLTSGAATDGQVLTADGAGGAAWESIAGLPKRATMWHDEATVTHGNALVTVIHTGAAYVTRSHQSADADADSFTHGCYLASGTYSFSVLGSTSDDRGKIDWTIDGASIVAGEDWYSSGLTHNVVKTTASVAVTTSGWHVIQGTINGKHASSSGYEMYLTKYWFKQSAD